jgi:hypothetical protein
MNVSEESFTKLLGAFPTSYASEQMQTLWIDTWSQHPHRVIARTVNTVVRTWQRFPSLDEFMELAEKESGKQSFISQREKMDACLKCDSGMVETKDNHFRPCDSCLPDGYGQWASGQYEPRKS